MRRWPRSTKTMKPTTTTMRAPRKIIFSGFMSPVLRPEIMLMRPLGKSTTMPAKMMSEMPLPMPRSEICSPSHMTKTVPVVRVRRVSRMKPQPG